MHPIGGVSSAMCVEFGQGESLSLCKYLLTVSLYLWGEDVQEIISKKCSQW